MNSPKTTWKAKKRLDRIIRDARYGCFRLPPTRTLSQWADDQRKLSPEASGEPGQWITARAEYQRGIMDAISDVSHEQIVMMLGSQLGKSELLLNTIGYYIDQQPSPILMVQPRVEDAKTFSKDRITPMLRDTPCLRDKVSEARRRDSNNTVTHKVFPGGHITLGGANSPAGLAMRPIRVVLADEVDRYPASAGTEGDPLSLAVRRTSTFWNRKVIMVSTPTIEGISRIAAAFEETDQRRFHVPCPDPDCSHKQTLVWANVRWDKTEVGSHLPETAAYCCEACGRLWNDGERWQAVQLGEWRATAESLSNKPGFHLNGLYSPWKRLGEYVTEWVEAQGHPERLKAFINTVLAEVYREKGEAPDWQRLFERRETWPQDVLPNGVLFLVAGADVQRDRVEVRVWGFGRNEQAWLVDTRIIPANPWNDATSAALVEILDGTWRHESGADLSLTRLAIDSGHATSDVYAWAAKHRARVMIVKGGPDSMQEVIRTPKPVEIIGHKRSRSGAKVWLVGSGLCKRTLYDRLKLAAPIDGVSYPKGYIHLPDWIGADETQQLTAEELATERTRTGFSRQIWRKVRERNEALDCLVYCYAAAVQFGMPRFSDGRWANLEMTLGAESTRPVAPIMNTPVAGAALPAQAPAAGVASKPRQSYRPRSGGPWLGRR